MAKLKDKLYNRIIEGKLTLQEGDDLEGLTPKYEVGSVESLSSEQIESLKAGDIVVKKTGNQRHAYIVSYKENGQGICLTYTDASCVETVSYDKSGDNWVYNSKDVKSLINVEDAQSGTIQDVLGLNSNGKVVKGHEINSNLTIFGSLGVSSGITAKTLRQSHANYSYNFSVEPIDSDNFESVGVQYSKIEVVNGELHIICLAKFHNKDTQVRSFSLSAFAVQNIPDEIASKIYGTSGNNIMTPNCGEIRVVPMGLTGGVTGMSIAPLRIQGNATPNSLTFYHAGGYNVNPDSNVVLSFEANLSLF